MKRKTRPVDERFWEKVHKTESCWLWTASLDPNGYGRFWDGEARVKAHRHSYQIANGTIALGIEVDHICHIRKCVNPGHLRAATRKQNGENRLLSSNNTSGVNGVWLHKPSGKWQARVGHFGRSFYLGYFQNLAEAEAAVVAKRRELFTHNDLDWVA